MYLNRMHRQQRTTRQLDKAFYNVSRTLVEVSGIEKRDAEFRMNFGRNN
jgi:hypothetical protein